MSKVVPFTDNITCDLWREPVVEEWSLRLERQVNRSLHRSKILETVPEQKCIENVWNQEIFSELEMEIYGLPVGKIVGNYPPLAVTLIPQKNKNKKTNNIKNC